MAKPSFHLSADLGGLWQGLGWGVVVVVVAATHIRSLKLWGGKVVGWWRGKGTVYLRV